MRDSDMKPCGDVTRLPKWAQDYVNWLERTLTSERETHRIMDAGESDTVVWGYGLEPDVSLPSGSHIRFSIIAGKYPRGEEITVRNHGDYIDVNSGTGTLAVRPCASNAVHIEVVER